MSRGTATPARPKQPHDGQVKTRTALREDYARTAGPLKVDREAGVIRGVKVCGIESRNGRRYPLETLKAATGLYEGISCNLNHPGQSPGRNAQDRIGWFQDVTLREDGLYADLHYLKTHPFANQLCEAAERRPELLGFSHNAEGDTEFVAGKPTVTRILEVRSVDLVADPATTNGLFEGERVVPTNLRKLLEGRTWTDKRKLWATWLLEDDAMPGMTTDLPAEPGDADPDAQLWTGFSAAINAILDQYKSGELDPAAAAKAIAKYVKAHARLTSEKEPDADPAGESAAAVQESDAEAARKNKEALETLERENAELKRDKSVTALCEQRRFSPSTTQRKALCLLPDDADRKALIEEFQKPPAPSTDRPRSGPPRVSEPVVNGKAPETAEEAGRRWRN